MNRIFSLSIAAVFLFGAVVVHGGFSIDCSNIQAIEINFTIPDIAAWDTKDTADRDAWALNGKTSEESCKPTFDHDNGLVVYAAFDVQSCGSAPTVTGANDTELQYEFVIDVDEAASSGAGSGVGSGAGSGSVILPITYNYDHQYSITCLYDREYKNLMASFEPKHSLEGSAADEGDLSITFTLHRSDDNNQITPGPNGDVIDLSTSIYGKVLVEAGGFPHLDVHFQSVTASSDNVGSNEFTLVADGCQKNNGVVDSVECDTDEDDKFFMKTNGAFRYPGQVTGDQVWFKAAVIICLANDSSSECQTECKRCGVTRKRRETVQDSLHTKYYLSAGPYRIGNSEKASAVDKDNGAAFPSYVIAVVAVCGVVAIAVICTTVLIVLRRRPQNSLTAESRDAEAMKPASYEQEVLPEYTDTIVL